MGPAQPLDGVGSIKLKIGLLVGLSVVAAALVAEIGNRAGVPAGLTVPVTVAAALAITQWLAHGMTAPLREMTAAAGRMAAGDYAVQVRTTSADEVGQLARAFTTMAADLAAADSERRQLIATVSHELRTPLAAQRALLENLVDGVVRPDDAALGRALAQAERLSDLVSDLLDVARVDGGAVPLDLAPVTVADLVDDALAEADLGPRPVRLRADVDPGLTVTGDRARLAQVLANLLDNAARHSPPGTTVTVRAGREGAERWYLEVADEGPGIPPGQEAHVFTRFGSADDGGGGTGLGLAIASWVCRMHGGSIGVVPAERGARVRAVLPVTPPPAHSPAPEEAPVSTAPTTAPATPTPSSRALGELWPEPAQAAAYPQLLGALGIGALAAAVLPYRDGGLGALLILLAGGGLVWWSSTRRTRRWTLLTGALCLVLSSFLVLRAADWLTVLALLVTAVLVTTALTDARRLAAVVAGAAAWPLSALRGLPLLGRTLSSASRHKLLWPVARTATVSLVALVVFGGLFASGDAVFGSWVAPLIPDLGWDGLILRVFVLVAVGGTVLAGCYLAVNPPRVEQLRMAEAPRVARTWEWLVPVGVVVAVYLGFVVAQASAMFGGHDYVRRVTGLTYAEYVHEGFGQLTAATALTLLTVGLTVSRAPHRDARDRLLLRVALGSLCVLTLVVVASALFRMSVYQDVFGYTVLRVLVDAFELWLGLLVVLVMAAGVRWSGWWLPRAGLVGGAAFLLVIGLANPEAWVARQNIERWEATGKIDTAYLSSLGPDATPTIADRLPPELAACALRSVGEGEPADVLEWNLGRARAAQVDVPALLDTSGCP